MSTFYALITFVPALVLAAISTMAPSLAEDEHSDVDFARADCLPSSHAPRSHSVGCVFIKRSAGHGARKAASQRQAVSRRQTQPTLQDSIGSSTQRAQEIAPTLPGAPPSL